MIELAVNKYAMNSLAIYGDSFAAVNHSHVHRASAGLHWVNVLGLVWPQISVYAEPATSLYWTYRNFVETHAHHDRVVVIATAPLRVTIRNHLHRNIPISASSINQVEYMLADGSMDPNVRRAFCALRDHLIWVQDQQMDTDMNQWILDDIRQQRPDAIIIPIGKLHGWGHEHASLKHLVSMSDLQRITVASLKPELLDQFDREGLRVAETGWVQAHMTPEVNTYFAQLLDDALEQAIWAPQLVTHVDHNLPWSHYYGEPLAWLRS